MIELNMGKGEREKRRPVQWGRGEGLSTIYTINHKLKREGVEF